MSSVLCGNYKYDAVANPEGGSDRGDRPPRKKTSVYKTLQKYVNNLTQ